MTHKKPKIQSNDSNKLPVKYEIKDLRFFDIENWKAMGTEEIKQLEDYFEIITSRSEIEKSLIND